MTVGSDGEPTACPPAPEYNQGFQARAAEELALLPEGSAIAEMLSDYAVMREQTRMGAFPMLSTALCVFPVASSAQTELQSLEFAYLTRRNKCGSMKPGEVYGGERSDLKAGICRVEELDLGILAPLADVAPNFLQEELLRVRDVKEMDPSAVLDGLEATAGACGTAAQAETIIRVRALSSE